jgi:SAM-dependent methyltransferase
VSSQGNIDPRTVQSFGHEWSQFDQSGLSSEEHRALFNLYFGIFPWNEVGPTASGFDMGCGSGRWARLVAPRVGHLTCIDPSEEALAVAKRNLSGQANVSFVVGSTERPGIPEGSQDFGYSLGVLHHIPDTEAALKQCVQLLKPGAPFLVYLYYSFDNKPGWYRSIWRFSELVRRIVSRLPSGWKKIGTDPIAVFVYYPLARAALACEGLGLDAANMPLYGYRNASLYTMRTDSRDRFGTPLEQRFSRKEIAGMMCTAGLSGIVFSEQGPFWCAVGRKNGAH